uniref:Phosphoglucomutase, putative n=1 Tax=Neospora caninum (strain Liverpool) TaxID=572307 RepID=A0A0F7U9D3_NEOCL|nr:TPA: phosphoglucomutase, putative [Neospora caninum Liverpool]
MGAGFSRMNDVTIQQTTQGYCAFLMDLFGEDGKDRGVVIGFDARHNSRRFAQLTAAVFLSKGVRVRLFGDIVHTPMVPYTVVSANCIAGIMITASHNPKADNGYKVYAANGAQIIPPMDSEISAFINSNLDFWSDVDDFFDNKTGRLTEKAAKSSLLEDPLNTFVDAYIKDIAADLCVPKREAGSVKFMYTAMHGVGEPMVKKMIAAFGFKDNLLTGKARLFSELDAQCTPDPEFPTVAFPNPEEHGALDMAFKEADAHGLTLVIANDPDADRFAAAEKCDGRWYQFTGDELGAILGAYAIELREGQGIAKSNMALICSAVSSRMLQKIAKDNGCRFAETMTGFKWMENKAIEMEAEGLTPVFVYEEALGYALSQRVRDKDGVSAAAVWMQMATDLYARGQTVMDFLMSLRKRYGYFVTKNSYFICPDPPVIQGLFKDFANGGQYPTHLGPFAIRRIRDVGRSYDSGETCTFPPNCEMLTVYLDNGAVVTLRGSGTEPKLKYYAETSSSNPEQGAAELEKVIAAVVSDFVKPDLHPAIKVTLP